MTVGLRASGLLGGYGAVGTGAVVDDDVLPQRLGQLGGDLPRTHVGRAACAGADACPCARDNRPGAASTIAGEFTARSTPDGHTMFITLGTILSSSPFLYPKLTYDIMKDFAYVSLVGMGNYVMLVYPGVPAKNVAELVALTKSKPLAFRYGSGGVGSPVHLSVELLKLLTGMQILHVPYKGGAPAMVDLLAGQVQMSFASTPTAMPNIVSGRLRALAVTTAQRSKLLPDVPTVAQAGVPGFEAHSWYGFVVPAKTPSVIVTRLNKEIVQILHRADAAEVLLKVGLEPWTSSPEEMGAYLKSEVDKWGRIIRELGITAN